MYELNAEGQREWQQQHYELHEEDEGGHKNVIFTLVKEGQTKDKLGCAHWTTCRVLALSMNKMLRTALLTYDWDVGSAESVSTIYGHTNCFVSRIVFKSLHEGLRAVLCLENVFTIFYCLLTFLMHTTNAQRIQEDTNCKIKVRFWNKIKKLSYISTNELENSNNCYKLFLYFCPLIVLILIESSH